MPRWVVVCPKCSHEFTHSEIEPTVLWRTHPFGVLPKPRIEKRVCPKCKTEFEARQLFYRQDARGQDA
jgi:hypothetical protein